MQWSYSGHSGLTVLIQWGIVVRTLGIIVGHSGQNVVYSIRGSNPLDVTFEAWVILFMPCCPSSHYR